MYRHKGPPNRRTLATLWAQIKALLLDLTETYDLYSQHAYYHPATSALALSRPPSQEDLPIRNTNCIPLAKSKHSTCLYSRKEVPID